MALKIVWNDILKERADAIVTTASRNPRIGIGLDRFVHRAAGPKLLAARKEMGRIAPGKVGVSSAFELRKATGAKWIIHAPGPMLGKTGDRREELILDGCYLRILLTAVKLGCKTVSIPVLSSGKFASGVNVMPKAVDIAVKAIGDFLEVFPALEVKLVGIDLDFFAYARKAYPALTVARLDEASAKKLRASFGDREDDPTDLEDSFTIGDEDDVFGDQLLERVVGDGTFLGMFHRLWDYTLKREKAAKRKAKGGAYDGEFLTGRRELAVRSGIGESTIKHFCSNSDAAVRTTKDKIVALAVAMRLPTDYAKRFLSTCGYSLGASRRDRIIAAFIAKRCGTVDELGYALKEGGVPPLVLRD